MGFPWCLLLVMNGPGRLAGRAQRNRHRGQLQQRDARRRWGEVEIDPQRSKRHSIPPAGAKPVHLTLPALPISVNTFAGRLDRKRWHLRPKRHTACACKAEGPRSAIFPQKRISEALTHRRQIPAAARSAKGTALAGAMRRRFGDIHETGHAAGRARFRAAWTARQTSQIEPCRSAEFESRYRPY